LNVRYGKSHVVFDFTVEVGDGELLAVLGRNGAGKTTTIRGSSDSSRALLERSVLGVAT